MKKPSNNLIKYTESHEWILRDEDNDDLVIGITQHAQEQLGEIVFVDLPQITAQVARGDTVAVIESVKAASDIYAPLTGHITAINEDLANNPALVNDSPYENGWLFRMQGDMAATEKLLTEEEYKEFTES